MEEERMMSRLVRDYEEIRDCRTLDGLIARLTAVRAQLPNPAQAEVKMRGDDIFGRRLSISYLRPQTRDEVECDARYRTNDTAPWLTGYVREA
jgi:hypothetical protein